MTSNEQKSKPSLNASTTNDLNLIRYKMRNALWAMFIGDSLSMPVHWYYNRKNIYVDFGSEGITGYEDAKHPHPEAFMMGSQYAPNMQKAKELKRNVNIIKDEHKPFYKTTLVSNAKPISSVRFHYHHGLKAGENTLATHLGRLLMRNIVRNKGKYRDIAFAQDFVEYMVVDNENVCRTDSDPYISRDYRYFFESYSNGNHILQCSITQQQVWSLGSHGAILRPMILSFLNYRNAYKAVGLGIVHQNILQRSENVSSALTVLIPMLLSLVVNEKMTVEQVIRKYGSELYLPAVNGKQMNERYRSAGGPMNISNEDMYDIHTVCDCSKTFDAFKMNEEMEFSDVVRNTLAIACYPEHGLPLMLYLMVNQKFDLRNVLMANANCGGDNVGRGSILGLLMGAALGEHNQALEALKKGLRDYEQLDKEINDFVDCCLT